MADTTVTFEDPDLARRVEQLSQYEIDQLPFGVILLDREATVKFYSATEARQSGYGTMPLGRNLFDVSRCVARADFREQVMRAIESGAADLDLGWLGDAADARREMRIRIQSARQGGVWLFIARDRAAATGEPPRRAAG
jgi:photoactive yellow protein